MRHALAMSYPSGILIPVPKTPHRPHVYINKIFRGSSAVARGVLTRDDLRSSAWRPLFRDVYADARLGRDHKILCVAVSRFVMPEGAAIAGRSAAYLYGVRFVRDDDPVEVLAPHVFGPVNGVSVHTGQLLATELLVKGTLSVTRPLRTCWDLARWLDPVEAVVYVDALAACRLVSRESLTRYAELRKGSRGHGRFVKVVELMDPRAESPPESRLRVRIVLAGLPKPVAQFVILRNGVFLARVDLAFPELMIAIEYDGRWHASADQLERDRKRLNKLLGADWVVFHVTADQMRHHFDDFVRELRSTIQRRQGHRPTLGK
jgi:hypothetical protein